jgi:hypothetical protein
MFPADPLGKSTIRMHGVPSVLNTTVRQPGSARPRCRDGGGISHRALAGIVISGPTHRHTGPHTAVRQGGTVIPVAAQCPTRAACAAGNGLAAARGPERLASFQPDCDRTTLGTQLGSILGGLAAFMARIPPVRRIRSRTARHTAEVTGRVEVTWRRDRNARRCGRVAQQSDSGKYGGSLLLRSPSSWEQKSLDAYDYPNRWLL